MGKTTLDLATLELLVGVDVHGSVGAASRAAGVAQPNASRALKALERHLGFPLIDRRPTGSALTAQGTVIAHWARRLLADADQLREIAEGFRSGHSAELTVCASMTVAEHLMPRWLGDYRSAHPAVRIHLQVHNSAQVFDLVSAGKCDIGFVESPSVPRGLHSMVVGRDELVVVVAPDHRWARRRRALTVAELASTPLIAREPGSGTRTTLDLALQEYERAAPLLELASAAAIRASVLNSVGPAVMSSLAVADQLETGELRRIEVDGLALQRPLRAVWRSPRKLEGPAAALARLIQK
jgi:molybdate transport repressor ModE-like protein